MRILIIFVILISNSYASDDEVFKNLVINEEFKKYESITFLDDKNNQLELNKFKGNLILLNFWATWCAPCKEEMPSLDMLTKNKNLDNLMVFPINVGKDSTEKALKFYEDLEIQNLIFITTLQ